MKVLVKVCKSLRHNAWRGFMPAPPGGLAGWLAGAGLFLSCVLLLLLLPLLHSVAASWGVYDVAAKAASFYYYYCYYYY